MKNLLLILGLFSAMMWISCSTDILEQEDPSVQAAADSATIVNYIADLGLSNKDSMLTTGVHYIVLDSGDSNAIDESDIVSFHYTGKLLNDTIFDTTIQKVADSIRLIVQADTVGVEASTVQLSLLASFSESRSFDPIEYTYSASGWTLGSTGLINGFIDGVSAALNKLKVGGSALIVIPSAQAYGAIGNGVLIPPNTVIAFELNPIKVEDQGQ